MFVPLSAVSAVYMHHAHTEQLATILALLL